MKRPPIALFVYNRLAHTKLTVEALRKNFGASETQLYIFSDGPRTDVDADKVAEVRSYVKSITGFADIITVEREQNLGLATSLISGINEVLDVHKSIIILEDDLITSPYFLRYMNDALQYYEHDERVASISAYSFPVQMELPETYFLKYTACWGWGTWKRGWALFEQDGKKLLDEIKGRGGLKKFDMNGVYPYSKMLEKQIDGNVDSWAVRWHASIFLADKLMLFPGRSLVSNIGHDGSGVNCNYSKGFDVKLSENVVHVGAIDVSENLEIVSALKLFFKELNPGIFSYLLKMFIRKVFLLC